MKRIDELKRKLNNALPEPNEDGTYGDGSHEYYAFIFESAYDAANAVAVEALEMLANNEVGE